VSDKADQYRRWFDFEKDSHAKVLRSLESVPEANRTSPAYSKAVDVLSHIAVARQLWLFRLGGVREAPAKLFLDGSTLAEAVETLRATEAGWNSYLAALADAELDRVFEYTSWVGGRYRNRVEDILTTLFGHSLYHRGQIAMLVKTAGGVPAETDFVFWCREPIEQAHHA
jgi:uncharacterized damage-inducible protein DinB